MSGDTSATAEERGPDRGWRPEIEIKLAVPPGAVERLLAGGPLAGARATGERRIESVYYDTRDRLLRRDGVALRVRRADAAAVQTIKTGAHAMARFERDDPLDRPEPSARFLREAGGERYRHVGDGDLLPVFVSRIDRRTLETIVGGGRIEIAIDRGTIEAAGRTEPVREIELELVAGAPADLYGLALALREREPLAIEPRAKSDRGYALAGGPPPPWRKAGPVGLDAAATLADGIAVAMAHCRDHWLANQCAAIHGADTEGVHQMRVAIRRLRAALDFFAPWLDANAAARPRRETGWLGKRLGAARDLDVLLADVVAPVLAARPGDRALLDLEESARKARNAAYDRLRETMSGPRYADLVLSSGHWIALEGWRRGREDAMARPLVDSARGALDSIHGRVVARDDGFDAMTAKERHGLRLDVKRLRYALQFVGPAFGDATAHLQVLSRLQDLLGAANDVAFAERRIAAAASRASGGGKRRRLARAGGLVAGWWTAKGAGREEETRAVWREFAGLAPFWRSGPR